MHIQQLLRYTRWREEGQGFYSLRNSRAQRVVTRILIQQLHARLCEEMWRYKAPDLDMSVAKGGLSRPDPGIPMRDIMARDFS